MKESPLSPLHARLGASMDNEDGWSMPRHFSNLLEEHLAAHSSCGIFDISHLAKISVLGHGAHTWLDSQLSNNVDRCHDGYGQRTLMLNEEGNIIDKITLFRETAGRFFLLGSAALAEEDFAWLSRHRPDGSIELQNETDRWSAMALYGPDSEKIFSRVLRGLDMPLPMTFQRVHYQNSDLLLTRAGLEADEGFELFCPASSGISWFESFIGAGAIPCGTATRECLRLERASASPGRSPDRMTPGEASLLHLCDRRKRYTGSAAVHRQLTQKPERRLASLHCTQASEAPHPGDSVQDEHGARVGSVTSGAISPKEGLGIALASLLPRLCSPGTRLNILIRGRAIPAIVSEQTLC